MQWCCNMHHNKNVKADNKAAVNGSSIYYIAYTGIILYI